MQAERWLAARPGDHVWCTAATGWAKSIWNVLLGPWSAGASIVLHEGAFEPEERFQLLSELGVSVLCQAPTEYRLMAKLDGLDRFELAGLRHMVSAGEPLNPEVIKAFRDAFGLTIHERMGYGYRSDSQLRPLCPRSGQLKRRACASSAEAGRPGAPPRSARRCDQARAATRPGRAQAEVGA